MCAKAPHGIGVPRFNLAGAEPDDEHAFVPAADGTRIGVRREVGRHRDLRRIREVHPLTAAEARTDELSVVAAIRVALRARRYGVGKIVAALD